MIEIKNVSKSFQKIKAADHVSIVIKEKTAFGLVGTNGAGKSTVLRLLAGIIRQDEGEILIDGRPVYDDPEVKRNVYFIADEPYFFTNGTARDMQKYLCRQYPKFEKEDFYEYLRRFELDPERKVNTFSKGMKKQLALICGICSGAGYLLCDETFDGLDPVMRQGVKSIFAGEMEKRNLTPVIASHNLRELEDICDSVGLLHKGGVMLSRELEDMKNNLQRVQCVFASPEDEMKVKDSLNLLKSEKRGSLYTYTIRGSREEVQAAFAAVHTVFLEVLPLTLEEIFISETEVVGYDIKKLILG